MVAVIIVMVVFILVGVSGLVVIMMMEIILMVVFMVVGVPMSVVPPW